MKTWDIRLRYPLSRPSQLCAVQGTTSPITSYSSSPHPVSVPFQLSKLRISSPVPTRTSDISPSYRIYAQRYRSFHPHCKASGPPVGQAPARSHSLAACSSSGGPSWRRLFGVEEREKEKKFRYERKPRTGRYSIVTRLATVSGSPSSIQLSCAHEVSQCHSAGLADFNRPHK